MRDKVRIFALGGLDERGKNLIVVEINDDIFILDAGNKHPDKTLPGVDLIIPDYKYLIDNKDRVKAYLVSHGHNEQIGAIPFMYKYIKAPIYCSKATAAMIDSYGLQYLRKPMSYNFNIVNPSDDVEIDGHKVHFFQTCHSMICSSGIAIDTDGGSIVYSGDFIVEYNDTEGHNHDLKKLSKIADNDVLLLMTESSGADNLGYASPAHKLTPTLNKVLFESKGRTYIAIFDKNIYGLEEILKFATLNNKKVVFYNSFVREMYERLSKCGLYTPGKNVIISDDELLRVKETDLIIVMMEEGEHVFEIISDLARGEIDDKRFIISPNDSFLVACPPQSGLEVIATSAIDDLYRTGANITNLSKKTYISMTAREDDLKALISMLKPKYYLPVSGEYRHLLANAMIAVHMGNMYSHRNVFIIDNGMVVDINDGVAKLANDKIQNGNLMVDGIGVGDVKSEVITDRQKLSEDGIIIAALAVSLETKEIIAGPDIQMRGFVFLKESESILREITKLLVETISNALRKNTSLEDAKLVFTEKAVRYIKKEIGRFPMVVPIVEIID
ncbi:MAG: ribonuclease J [Erysipelotrichales bacterium]|nr:ribonuclease J [Erysipelotrichales bacterium]